jgi:hypothetical protein
MRLELKIGQLIQEKTNYTNIFSTLVNNVSATGIVIDNGTNEISMVILNGATTHVKY